MTLFSAKPTALSKDINDRKESIVAKWLVRLKSEIPAVSDLPDDYLIDEMPEFLTGLAASLSSPDDRALVKKARANARAHGAQRTRSKYAVSHVISDYIFLREVLIAELREEPSKAELLSLSRFFEAAIGAAVEEFTSTQQKKSADEDLKTIADAVLTLIMRVDLDFKYVFVNRAYEEWKGRSAASVLGKPVEEFVDPADYPAIYELLSRASLGERISFENRMRRGDGTYEHMLYTLSPAHDRNGHVSGVVITGQSIEQQKLAEFDAQERKRELSNAFSQAPTPIALMMGPDHVFALANPPYVEFVGRNPVGRKVRSVFSEEEAGEFFEILDQVYETGQPYFGKELPFTAKNEAGEFVDYRINVAYHPYRAGSGEVIGILAFIYDVTEQVRAREAVQDSELRLRAIFAHAAVGFAVSDLSGRFLEVNPRFCEITGYSVEELKERAVIDIVHSGDLEMDRQRLNELTSGRVDNFVIEKRFVKKDGSIAWVRNSVSLVPGGREPLIIRVAEDVTAVREAERLRRESEEQYRLLADSMPQIVWTAGEDGLIDLFNKVWYDYTGCDPSKDPTTQWNEVALAEDLPPVLEDWMKCLESGSQFEGKVRLRSRQGEYRWFMVRGRPIRDENGRVKRWYGTNTDIHDFQMLNERLERSQRAIEGERRKFTSLVSEATTPIAVVTGPDLTFEIANKSYINLFDNREIIGKPLLEALPELADQAFPRLLRAAYEGVPYREHEAYARLRRTDDGELEDRYFDQSYSQMRDPDGQPYGVVIQAVDVTERVQARRRLEEVVERFQVAIAAADMGTWDLNPQTGEVTWSERTNELFGLSRHAKLNLSAILEHVHEDDQPKLEAGIAKAIDPANSPDFRMEYRVLRPGGDVRWVLAFGRANRVKMENGEMGTTRFSGIVLDVTDRVMAEVAMRDAKERAELANAAKSSFLANMSHEIRTPLGAIMGFVSLIKDEGASPQTLNNYISVIERNSAQLMRIIDDILDLSKVEAGMMVIEHIDFSLVELLSDFASLMGFRAREKGVLFELKAMTELPDIVNSDPTRIRQILTNIVGNAIKFTDHGSVVLRVSSTGGQLLFDVADTGRGISNDQAEKLFQPFSQGDASTTRKYGGTGLGLVLTRRLSEALGGSFELVSSEHGVGSRFIAKINVRLPERSRLVRALGFASEPIRNAGVQGRLRDLRILLVEDSPDNQALFSIYLNRAGAKIDIAADGQRGVEMALSEGYDVVLMDVQMPIMDGITAVRKLRASGYETPIIALTAHAMKEEKIRCLEAGYSGFLSKPIQRAELVDALAKYRQDH